MFECKVCGLLSLGGGACPACGSLLLVDLTLEDGDSSPLPTEVPGLDDAVTSWYELEGIEPPAADAESPPQPSSSSGSLPFGFSGESNTNVSRLPFGVGSYAAGVPFEEDEEALPLISDRAQSLPTSENISPVASTLTPPLKPETHPVMPTAPQNIPPQPPLMATDAVSGAQAPVEQIQVPSFTPSEVAPPPIAPPLPVAPVQPPIAPPLPAAPVQPATTHVRIEPAPLAPAEFNQPQALRISPVEPIAAVEVPSAPLLEAVPDMWRIDASPVNMDELYAAEDQVVEVVHTMDDDDTYMHGTDFEDLHPDSGIISLELHPAKAIGVNLSGIPELEETLAEGFYAIGEESWAQAAIAFQKMAAKMPGDSAVFNNYGLALLQRALSMAKSSDLEVQQLASTQFESAILALREAAKSSPANGTILLNLTHALLVSGRAEKALNLLFMYQKHNENTPESANLEAATLVSMGESGRALEVLQSVKQDVTIAANISKLTYS